MSLLFLPSILLVIVLVLLLVIERRIEHEHDLPAERRDGCFDVGKIVDHLIRLMFRQLVAGEAPGRDRNRARADCFPARDIVRGVANDVDICRGEIGPVLLPRAPLRKGAELVPIVMIIGERAELEKIPDPIVRKLQLRAPFDIAGKEPKNILWSRVQARQELLNTGKNPPFPTRQFARQKIGG